MFTGAHRVRVDDKGRLAIPASFRKQLREGSFVSVGQDQVLAIYPPDLWAALGEELRSPVEIWPEARWDNYSADAQGRFTEFADRVISGH